MAEAGSVWSSRSLSREPSGKTSWWRGEGASGTGVLGGCGNGGGGPGRDAGPVAGGEVVCDGSVDEFAGVFGDAEAACAAGCGDGESSTVAAGTVSIQAVKVSGPPCSQSARKAAWASRYCWVVRLTEMVPPRLAALAALEAFVASGEPVAVVALDGSGALVVLGAVAVLGVGGAVSVPAARASRAARFRSARVGRFGIMLPRGWW